MKQLDNKTREQMYNENKKTIENVYNKVGGKMKSDTFVDFMKSTVDPKKKDIILTAITRGKLAQFSRMNRFKNV